MTSEYNIAQLNIGRIVAPIDHPRLADFVAWLDEINALAERSPGFVWRLQGDNGNATQFQVVEDPLVIVNLTVWRSVEELHAFTYRTDHKAVFARRFDWFERWVGPSVVLWWQAQGAIPAIDEALRRLQLLADNGPTPEAFTFKERFPPPATAAAPATLSPLTADAT
jgi:hypothetical protein